MRKHLALAAVVASTLAIAPAAVADPKPPTNGGNGAGQSGQCTGPASERPTSCQSPGGVSDKG
jgi:Spy/CpxP family protein refolding chaperone